MKYLIVLNVGLDGTSSLAREHFCLPALGLTEAVTAVRTALASRQNPGEWALVLDEHGRAKRRYVTDRRGVVRRRPAS